MGALFLSSPFSGVCLGEKLSTVTLQLHWQHQFEYAGYYAAKEKGFYAEEGLQVDIREIDSEVSAVESVVSGKAEYGIWPSGIVLERMKNVPVVLLANDLKSSLLILLASDTNIVS